MRDGRGVLPGAWGVETAHPPRTEDITLLLVGRITFQRLLFVAPVLISISRSWTPSSVRPSLRFFPLTSPLIQGHASCDFGDPGACETFPLSSNSQATSP